MRLFYLLILIAIVATVWTISPAIASDQLPPPDPEGTWRVITQDPATTTSKCIGDTSTPVCALETLLACFARNDYPLCAQTMLNPFEPTGEVSNVTYRIYESRRLQCNDPLLDFYGEDYGNDYPSTPRKGDVDFYIKIKYCEASEIKCKTDDAEDGYIGFRKIDDHWMSIGHCIGDCD